MPLLRSISVNCRIRGSSTFEFAMQIERERFHHASHYERNPDRQRYANGYKPKRIDTPVGSITVAVPKTAGHVGEPFYPRALERGRRSVRAVMLGVVEMYIKGASTRDVEAVMREFGIESLSSAQVSRASKLLDDQLVAWRTRSLTEIRYLILDARYEKMRDNGVLRDAAVLSAIGIGPDERRHVLGVSVALSKAEVQAAWCGFRLCRHRAAGSERPQSGKAGARKPVHYPRRPYHLFS
ncbi:MULTISPECIES: transposase [Acidiphilium]|uniref:transposase n=1 Tax=Acidiphilium TaxID=522 RepID=UPI00257ABAB6|nr:MULTISPECIES: transposase [Acidiphilium]HQT85058.1 transposase [Acidiphilium rubrum]